MWPPDPDADWIGEVLACVRGMLTPTPARAVSRWVCWVTAASLVVCLVQSTFASTRTPPASANPTPAADPAVAPNPAGALRGAAARDASVLFVAGPNEAVRFRVDLRDGTVATPRTRRMLDRVIDVLVSERIVLLCQAGAAAWLAPKIVGFDLHTGQRTDASRARVAHPHFCAGHRSATARAQETWSLVIAGQSKDLQRSLERQATTLPRVSNGEAQSSFLISSRHSSSSLVTMPPGQS